MAFSELAVASNLGYMEPSAHWAESRQVNLQSIMGSRSRGRSESLCHAPTGDEESIWLENTDSPAAWHRSKGSRDKQQNSPREEDLTTKDSSELSSRLTGTGSTGSRLSQLRQSMNLQLNTDRLQQFPDPVEHSEQSRSPLQSRSPGRRNSQNSISSRLISLRPNSMADAGLNTVRNGYTESSAPGAKVQLMDQLPVMGSRPQVHDEKREDDLTRDSSGSSSHPRTSKFRQTTNLQFGSDRCRPLSAGGRSQRQSKSPGDRNLSNAASSLMNSWDLMLPSAGSCSPKGKPGTLDSSASFREPRLPSTGSHSPKGKSGTLDSSASFREPRLPSTGSHSPKDPFNAKASSPEQDTSASLPSSAPGASSSVSLPDTGRDLKVCYTKSEPSKARFDAQFADMLASSKEGENRREREISAMSRSQSLSGTLVSRDVAGRIMMAEKNFTLRPRRTRCLNPLEKANLSKSKSTSTLPAEPLAKTELAETLGSSIEQTANRSF